MKAAIRNRRGFAKVVPLDHGEPIWRPNIAAVANILSATLILLMIHLIPPTYHVISIDILNPQGAARTDLWGRPNLRLEGRLRHMLGIARSGAIVWDGQIVSEAQLYQNLQIGMTRQQEPEIIFSPDADAPYGMALRVLGVVKAAGVTLFCFDPRSLAAHRDFAADWEHTPMRLTRLTAPAESPAAPVPTATERIECW